jgi:2-polyprenyl-3-methyl-5-hydroxy-6-metoxy-1,4-benzoquinol methylase
MKNGYNGPPRDYHFKAYFSKFHLSHMFHKNKVDRISSFIESGKTVLDAGCGSSVLPYLLIKKGCTVHGIDINPEFIDFISKKCNGKFYHGDIRNFKLKRKFDVITCIDVIEHFKTKDRLRILKNFDLHLKKGGTIIFAFPSSFYLNYIEGFWHLIRNNLYKGHKYDDIHVHVLISTEELEIFLNKLGYRIYNKGRLCCGIDNFVIFKKD